MKASQFEIIDFIKNCTPHFGKEGDEYTMFTIVTQHVKSVDIEDMIQYGIDQYQSFGNKSPIIRCMEQLEENSMLK